LKRWSNKNGALSDERAAPVTPDAHQRRRRSKTRGQ
jgi:hypothetical protein